MTREIKFRAWDEKSKGYITGSFLNCETGEIEYDDGVATEGDLNILLEQYTGMHDVNGNEIYEGDVVKLQAGSPDAEDVLGFYEFIGVVEMIEGMWVLTNEAERMSIQL